jgi:hypothetical protein
MATKQKFVEGTAFMTFRRDSDDRYSGWRWLCLLGCLADDESARGWRWERVNARRDARKHCETEHAEQPAEVQP